MSTITISLPDALKAFVEQEVSTQGYGNVSEYFRSLLREAQSQEARRRLEAQLTAALGEDSARADATFWTQLRLEAQRLLAAHPAAEQSPWPRAVVHHRAALEALCQRHTVQELALVGASVQGAGESASTPLEFAVHLGELRGAALAAAYANFSSALGALLECPIDLIEIGSMGPTRLRRVLEQSRRVVYPPSGRR